MVRRLDQTEKQLLAQQPIDLQPANKPHTTKGWRVGYKLPNGDVFMDMNSDRVSPAVHALYAKAMNAVIVTVFGEWTFTPSEEQRYNNTDQT